MTNTWIVVYANCLVLRQKSCNLESDDLGLSSCISNYLCDLGKSLNLPWTSVVPLDNGNHTSQDGWNNINPCSPLKSFMKSTWPCWLPLPPAGKGCIVPGEQESSLHFCGTSGITSPGDFKKRSIQMLPFARKSHFIQLSHMHCLKKIAWPHNELSTPSPISRPGSLHQKTGEQGEILERWKNTEGNIAYSFELENMRPSGFHETIVFLSNLIFRQFAGNTSSGLPCPHSLGRLHR